MQVQDIHRVRPELLEADVDRLEHLVVHVLARLAGIDNLGGQRQAAVAPAGLARERLLLAADVDARRVDLVVAGRLERVEHLVVLRDVGHARARGLVWAKGHEAEDHPRLGVLGDEGRHFVLVQNGCQVLISFVCL